MHPQGTLFMRKGRAGRLLGAAAITLLAWLAFAALAPASGLACSNVEFIGVRGSGESYSGNYGMGNQIGALYERVQARKPSNQTLQSYGLEYPAVNVAEWWKAILYYPSVWEGDSHLESRIKGDASACPSMRWFCDLVGLASHASVRVVAPRWS